MLVNVGDVFVRPWDAGTFWAVTSIGLAFVDLTRGEEYLVQRFEALRDSTKWTRIHDASEKYGDPT